MTSSSRPHPPSLSRWTNVGITWGRRIDDSATKNSVCSPDRTLVAHSNRNHTVYQVAKRICRGKMYKLILYWNTNYYIILLNILNIILYWNTYYLRGILYRLFQFLIVCIIVQKKFSFFFFAYLVIPYILVSVKIISITTRFPAGKRVFYGYNGDI